MNYLEFLNNDDLDDRNHVMIFSFEKWDDLMKQRSRDFREALIITTTARNIKRNGFLYPVLEKYEVDKESIGYVNPVILLLNGDYETMKSEVRAAAMERERVVLSYNYEHDTGLLSCDFILGD